MSASPLRAGYWHMRETGRACLQRVSAAVKPWRYRSRLRGTDGWLAVRIDARIGFFAQMNWALMILAHCDEHELQPYIELTGPFYADRPGENWFGHFFELTGYDEGRARVARGELPLCSITELSQLGLSPCYERDMTLERANALWGRYTRIESGIASHVESFAAQHFAGREVLGVHYRGTDKSSEAPRLGWDICVHAVKQQMAAQPDLNTVFVASDEAAFVDYIGRAFADTNVVSHDDRTRSTDGSAVHVQPTEGGNRLKGQEALVNALLLARCATLIRSASFLSGWASVFNPALPVALLNRPYESTLWFPDREVIKRGAVERANAFVHGMSPERPA